ncbi:MAG: undecaprenyldiphospho-muramoylpentapeptide beta-N-acetylglucosaminyltransferase [Alphaproteobacteria bacterium]
MEKGNLILAAGGTGGHIFPAQALAEELAKKNYTPILITDKRYLRYASQSQNPKKEFITAGTPYARGAKKLLSLSLILGGVIKSIFLLKKYKPKAVIGFGGYPAFPTLYAAKLLKIPIIIHEQNSALGRVNKYFIKIAKAIAISFEPTAGLNDVEKEKVILTGNPVRKAILAISKNPYPEITDRLNILVIGGSQGASIFSEVVPNALASLPQEMQTKIKITQQCIVEDIEKVRSIYQKTDLDVELAAFFNDMHLKLKEAHLVISRSGASTISELQVAARPAIIVPIPYSFDNHQMHNARSFVANETGWIIPQDNFTPQKLAEKIKTFVLDPQILKESAKKFKANEILAVESLLNVIENVINDKS